MSVWSVVIPSYSIPDIGRFCLLSFLVFLEVYGFCYRFCQSASFQAFFHRFFGFAFHWLCVIFFLSCGSAFALLFLDSEMKI